MFSFFNTSAVSTTKIITIFIVIIIRTIIIIALVLILILTLTVIAITIILTVIVKVAWIVWNRIQKVKLLTVFFVSNTICNFYQFLLFFALFSSFFFRLLLSLKHLQFLLILCGQNQKLFLLTIYHVGLVVGMVVEKINQRGTAALKMVVLCWKGVADKNDWTLGQVKKRFYFWWILSYFFFWKFFFLFFTRFIFLNLNLSSKAAFFLVL